MENQIKESFASQEKRTSFGRPGVPPNLFADKPANPVSRKKFIVMTGLFVLISVTILLYPRQVKVCGTGKTVPAAIHTVSAAIAGKIIEVNVSEGEEVKAGSLLLKLANEKLEMEIEDALKEKEINAVKIDKLVEEKRIQENEVRKSKVFYEVGGIPRAEEIAAENKLVVIIRNTAIACREKDKIETKLQYLQSLKKKEEITAPIDGIILTPLKDRIGKHLVEGEEALKIGGKEIVIEASIPEENARDLFVGSKAVLRFSSVPLKGYHGNVIKVDSKVEEEVEKVWLKKTWFG